MPRVGTLVRKVIGLNCRISRRLDALADRFVARPSGMDDFTHRVVPGLLAPKLRVLDVGGGRSPILDPALIRQLELHVTGLDISADELLHAPSGSYHETIVANISRDPIPGRYDLILSRSVLEHLEDTPAALTHLAAALSQGGVMAHFLPCRNAPFARLNLLLGPRLSRRLLHAIYPQRVSLAGFPAHYDHCTHAQLTSVCRAIDLEIFRLTSYYRSDYLHCFFPAHILDLFRQLLVYSLSVPALAETMILVARRRVHTTE